MRIDQKNTTKFHLGRGRRGTGGESSWGRECPSRLRLITKMGGVVFFRELFTQIEPAIRETNRGEPSQWLGGEGAPGLDGIGGHEEHAVPPREGAAAAPAPPGHAQPELRPRLPFKGPGGPANTHPAPTHGRANKRKPGKAP